MRTDSIGMISDAIALGALSAYEPTASAKSVERGSASDPTLIYANETGVPFVGIALVPSGASKFVSEVPVSRLDEPTPPGGRGAIVLGDPASYSGSCKFDILFLFEGNRKSPTGFSDTDISQASRDAVELVTQRGGQPNVKRWRHAPIIPTRGDVSSARQTGLSCRVRTSSISVAVTHMTERRALPRAGATFNACAGSGVRRGDVLTPYPGVWARNWPAAIRRRPPALKMESLSCPSSAR
jgi:hypothetical protein